MQRYISIKGNKNIIFDNKTKTYYLRKQVGGKRRVLTTGIKGEVSVKKDEDGRVYAIPRSGYQRACKVSENLSIDNEKKERPTFEENFNLTLALQKNKAKRTYILALDGDKNVRPFFIQQCPFIDEFESDYERYWNLFRNYKKTRNPTRKLAHDRKYLVMVLRRAKKRGQIGTSFSKSDFPLNEVSEAVGKALTDEQVRRLIAAAKALGHNNLKIQIMLAVTMGLRKSEILGLQKDEIDLESREIDLAPARLKIRKARQIKVPIANDVYPLIGELVEQAKGPHIFPLRLQSPMGVNYNWHLPQNSMAKSWKSVKDLAGVDCRFHDLRHTCITNMVQAGIHLATISKMCGCSLAMANKVYDRVNEPVKEKLRNVFTGKFNTNKSTKKERSASKMRAKK